jgi:hypothetical protein
MSVFAEHGTPNIPIVVITTISGTTFTGPAYKHHDVGCVDLPDVDSDWVCFTDATAWFLLPREMVVEVVHPT